MSDESPDEESAREPSPEQIAANRQNATRSTGPRTTEGKARSARNALRHGGYASAEPIDGGPFAEDPDELAEFVDGIITSLAPRDAIERAVANEIATNLVRSARLTVAETVALSRDFELMAHTGPVAAHRAVERLDQTGRVSATVVRNIERLLRQYQELQKRGADDAA